MTSSSNPGSGRITGMIVPALAINAVGIGQNGGKLNMVELSPEEFEQLVASKKQATIPDKFSVYPAYPNPFNPVTTLMYDLPERSFVSLKVYDINGRLIKTLINSISSEGVKSVQWHGTNDQGEPVATGMYFSRFEAISQKTGEIFTSSNKMILLK